MTKQQLLERANKAVRECGELQLNTIIDMGSFNRKYGSCFYARPSWNKEKIEQHIVNTEDRIEKIKRLEIELIMSEHYPIEC